MDMHVVKFPTIWSQLSSPLFKEGERVLAAINGTAWSGPSQIQWHVRTMFQDIEHGSDMQMSTLLMNLFETIALERRMPEELLINTDNASKETKNVICMWWMIWLLCVCEIARLPLWIMVLINLIAGHNHRKCDRFFSRIRAA